MRSFIKPAAIFQVLLVSSLTAIAANAESPAAEKNGSSRAQSRAEKPAESLKVEIVTSGTHDKESQEVLDALAKLLEGLEHKDLKEIEACLSEKVTKIDEQSKQVLYGKAEILEDIKKNVLGTASQHKISSLVVYNPFISIKDDTAMVSFRATKEMSGSSPSKFESWCSEVFERKNGNWLVLQLRTHWKPISANQ
ncbi:MAG: DUF4440 domain-containing protein [Candidatus Obscuribacterales bacterium]|nr:DUF4440 domain-containing protein [Candidatus Obscuribacterales bacterium]